MGGQNTFVDNRPVRNAGDVPVTPAGGISATTVQAAIEELDTEKLAKASNLSDVANAATAFANIKQAATDAVTGVILKSTDAKIIAGTDTASAATPANIEAKIGASVVDTTLSGTPKIFRITDSAGTPYYFKAYPTKS